MKSDLEYIHHIVREILFLKEELKKTNKELFFNDEVLKRAYVKSIEIIGEASNKISPDFKKKYSSTEWRKFSATRNHLVHGYFIVDYEIIWDIVENKIQILEVEMNKIIQNEKTLFDT